MGAPRPRRPGEHGADRLSPLSTAVVSSPAASSVTVPVAPLSPSPFPPPPSPPRPSHYVRVGGWGNDPRPRRARARHGDRPPTGAAASGRRRGWGGGGGAPGGGCGGRRPRPPRDARGGHEAPPLPALPPPRWHLPFALKAVIPPARAAALSVPVTSPALDHFPCLSNTLRQPPHFPPSPY